MINYKNLFVKNHSTSLAIILLFTLSLSINAQSLKEVANSKGVYIGTIMNNQMVNNTNTDGGKPNNIIRGEFNALVLENAMKMNAVMPNRPSNPFSFGAGALNKGAIDKFLRYAKDDVPSDPLYTRGHTLIWYSQAPNWLQNDAKNWSSQQVYDFTYQYIKALVTYCGNKIDEWDVINEVLHDGGGSTTGAFRGNVWYSKAANSQSGLDDYFKFCFETAREFAPNAKLFYNDYNIEQFGSSSSGNKNGRMRDFVTRLKNTGTPIDAVGFQSHFTLSEMTSGGSVRASFINNVRNSMEFIDDLGLDVAITELDIRRCGSGSDAAHKAAYKAITEMALSQPNCNLLLIWGISDKDSWTIPWFNCDYSLIFDDNFDRKSAYFGVREALTSLSGGTILRNKIYEVLAPTSVKQGETVTITVTYESSDVREIAVLFQLDSDPWTGFQEERVSVNAGDGTKTIDITIPLSTPAAENAYQFQVYLVSPGGVWDDRFDNLEKQNIDVTASVIVKEPYSGTPIAIPGTLEVEEYDKGGQDISYNDADVENNGSGFRESESVDVTGGNGSYVIGWTVAGEWLEYTVDVSKTANYDLTFSASSLNGGGELGIEIDGNQVGTGIVVPSTGDWNQYSDFTEMINLPEGNHVLRVNIEKSGFNLDKIVFAESSIASSGDKVVNNAFKVFPNPSSSGVFYLEIETEFEVYNLIGEAVFRGNGNSINLSNQADGVYMVKIQSGTFKMVKN